MLLIDILVHARFMVETVVAVDTAFFSLSVCVTRWVVASSYTSEGTPSALAFLLLCGLRFYLLTKVKVRIACSKVF